MKSLLVAVVTLLSSFAMAQDLSALQADCTAKVVAARAASIEAAQAEKKIQETQDTGIALYLLDQDLSDAIAKREKTAVAAQECLRLLGSATSK